MSSEDQVRPFHAKEEGSGQEAADAVAAVLKHAAEHDKAAREKSNKKQPKWMLPLGVNLAVFAVYLLIAPPAWRGWVTVNPIEGPTSQVRADGLRTAMYLQAQRIEQYRIDHGALPETLADAGSPIPGVEYHRQGSSYQLVGTSGDAGLVYDSSESLADFGGSVVANRLSGG